MLGASSLNQHISAKCLICRINQSITKKTSQQNRGDYKQYIVAFLNLLFREPKERKVEIRPTGKVIHKHQFCIYCTFTLIDVRYKKLVPLFLKVVQKYQMKKKRYTYIYKIKATDETYNILIFRYLCFHSDPNAISKTFSINVIDQYFQTVACI